MSANRLTTGLLLAVFAWVCTSASFGEPVPKELARKAAKTFLLREKAPAVQQWVNVGAMTTARSAFTATLLDNGKILIAGGRITGDGYTNGCELFDPATHVISPAASMSQARAGHKAVNLADGKVLVVGGQGPGGEGAANNLNSCEIYNAATNTWSNTANLGYATGNHGLVMLDNETVLKVSGATASGFGTRVCEIYDPNTQNWSNTGSTSVGHQFPACVKLSNGKVVVAGGYPFNSSVELYDPNTGAWSRVGNLSNSVSEPRGVQLDDGRVVIMGGTSHGVPAYSAVDIYNPADGIISAGPAMLTPRNAFRVVKLSGGHLLAISGYSTSSNTTDACDRYEPTSGAWSAGPPVITSRANFGSVYSNGVVHIVGGVNRTASGSTLLSSIEALGGQERTGERGHWLEYR